MIVAVSVDGMDEIQAAINRLASVCSNMSPFFESIISDFYKSNEKLIFSASPGKYADLKDSTKRQKQRIVGFVYPILVMKKRLKNSLTQRGASENITVNKPLELTLGTRTPYGNFIQHGTSRMQERPFLLVDVGGRKERWLRIIKAGIQAFMGGKP